MFVVGLELDLSHLKQKAPVAWVISNIGIIVPFLLGLGVSVLLYPGFGSPATPFTAFALFMGIAMSITAFPVLVRILKDRGMDKTPLGTMAIACAAVATVDGVRLVVGGVADVPMAREFPHLEADALADALNAFAYELDARDDVHATARYRRDLVRMIGRDLVREVLQ